MKDILLIRHGETAWNAERRLQGHLDIPLNEVGLRQAEALAASLAKEGIGAIVSSDLSRARQTAAALGKVCGLPVDIDASLRERCFGAFEGMLYADIPARYPEAWAVWQTRDPDVRFPDGERRAETLREFYERATAAVTAAAARTNAAKLAIVCHGGVLDCVLRAMRGLDLRSEREVPMLNAAVNRLQWDGHALHLQAWGDVAHLTASALDEAST